MSTQTNTLPRSAIVTGAAQGIGRAIAERLAQDGLSVLINDVSSKEDTLSELKSELTNAHPSQDFVVFAGDISKEEVVKRMVEAAVDAFEGLDVIVANAGIGGALSFFVDTPVEQLDKVISVNLRGVYLCYQYAARQMIKQGRGGKIIGACSLAGKKGMALTSAYSSSKFAVRGLTQSVATELGQYGINVNAYAPGYFPTPLVEAAAKECPGGPDAFIAAQASVLNRPGRLEEIAAAVSFLASEGSSYMTGQTITVDGGRHFD